LRTDSQPSFVEIGGSSEILQVYEHTLWKTSVTHSLAVHRVEKRFELSSSDAFQDNDPIPSVCCTSEDTSSLVGLPIKNSAINTEQSLACLESSISSRAGDSSRTCTCHKPDVVVYKIEA
jgi:hypothetical protein